MSLVDIIYRNYYGGNLYRCERDFLTYFSPHGSLSLSRKAYDPLLRQSFLFPNPCLFGFTFCIDRYLGPRCAVRMSCARHVLSMAVPYKFTYPKPPGTRPDCFGTSSCDVASCDAKLQVWPASGSPVTYVLWSQSKATLKTVEKYITCFEFYMANYPCEARHCTS